ncbi:hypothetical protein ACQKOF_12035 [Lysinibacillus sp. NPDC093190]|uniref:hypothetical protein n=1 Tax=Lysinibacillus sp. NPDC093190 TaxID=3390575 RepID=UPI003D00979E
MSLEERFDESIKNIEKSNKELSGLLSLESIMLYGEKKILFQIKSLIIDLMCEKVEAISKMEREQAREKARKEISKK